MPSRSSVRTLLHSAGILLGVAGIVFVGQRLVTYGAQIDLRSINPAGYFVLVLLSALYGASNILLAAGWREILARLGATPTFRWAVWAYAVSQLAKYVPGNIFHLVGRQALGAAAGMAHGPLAKSAIMELAVVALCAVLFVPLLLALYWPAGGGILGPVLFGGAILLAMSVARRVFGRALARSALFYTLYLAISGIVFLGTYLLSGGQATMEEMPVVAGAYVLAWLAGLVTPGAPAGIGVREAVLLVLLGNLAAPPVILLAVVMGRAVTVVGDVGFYLAGHSIGRPREARKADG